ncbi:hypothetical protein DPMN_149679 [Dreissena polymorpha]|uniref:PiggyBac transposable element-derived protein domain-containing protein n=1 Tax=Dreissena polymorpha TaxID=45954 RepID=A0A9D4FHU7_DREPO|nr:hypothetical protein DPMN_149679 [Dreissena polymorpha]
MFQPMMFAEIARHTNNYATWKMESEGRHDLRWTETDSAEIGVLIGLNIWIGINKIPTIERYWSKKIFIGNQGFKSVMTSNRYMYQKLNQYFHVSDRANDPHQEHQIMTNCTKFVL